MTAVVSLPARVTARITLRPSVRCDGDCWVFEGCGHSKGYGKVRVGAAMVYVHRFAYELLVGPIPDGMTLDHLCRVKRCCNPGHLEVVTRAENGRRGQADRLADLAGAA